VLEKDRRIMAAEEMTQPLNGVEFGDLDDID
jgi:hypothetical protein